MSSITRLSPMTLTSQMNDFGQAAKQGEVAEMLKMERATEHDCLWPLAPKREDLVASSKLLNPKNDLPGKRVSYCLSLRTGHFWPLGRWKIHHLIINSIFRVTNHSYF